MITDEAWEQMFTNKFEAVKSAPLGENFTTQPTNEENFFEKLLAMNKVVVPADEGSPKGDKPDSTYCPPLADMNHIIRKFK